MKLEVFVLMLFVISFVSGICDEGQININEASLEELDELYWIGPVKAQAIVDARDFDFVDDLIDVYGIGPATLEGIKNQGWACVEGEEESIEEVALEEDKEIVEAPKDILESASEDKEDDEIKTITLTTQTIKSADNKKNKSNYAVFGFVGFCFLLGILFLVRKRKYKNEFR